MDVVSYIFIGILMMKNGRKGGTAEEDKAALIQAVEMAFEAYNGVDSVTTIDLKEMRKQAQDADQ